MIHSVTCKNFYSLGEETTLSFVVNDNAPKNNSYFVSPSGIRLSKAEVVIGSNASGKTNLLKIIPFLKWLIVDAFNFPPQMPLAVLPFKFSDLKNKSVELSVVFELVSGVYTYSFTLNESKILSEKLRLTSFVKEKNSTKTMFSRTWNNETSHYDFEEESSSLPKGFENLLRSNASVVAVASRLNHKNSQEITDFWQKIETNVGALGWIGDNMGIPRQIQVLEPITFFDQNPLLKKAAENLLARFDLGLKSFEIKKTDMGNGLANFDVQVAHSFGDTDELFPLQYESTGTKQLFCLLKLILKALDTGGIVIIDEFDASLHPEMLMLLFDLFINPENNDKNAQILFSTHNHQILSKLDKYQIYLTEKKENGITEAWRLDEMEGVRADDNYFTKYIAGAYGAVPNI